MTTQAEQMLKSMLGVKNLDRVHPQLIERINQAERLIQSCESGLGYENRLGITSRQVMASIIVNMDHTILLAADPIARGAT